MFFMIGISDGIKEFEFGKMLVCPGCGRYGHLMVYMTYTVLSLFFIPCFKWNKQYFVRMSCCGKTYRLDPEIGKRIAKGENPDLNIEDLEEVPAGWNQNADGGWNNGTTTSWAQWKNEVRTCENCGYIAEVDFEYCPKCGHKLP